MRRAGPVQAEPVLEFTSFVLNSRRCRRARRVSGCRKCRASGNGGSRRCRSPNESLLQCKSPLFDQQSRPKPVGGLPISERTGAGWRGGSSTMRSERGRPLSTDVLEQACECNRHRNPQSEEPHLFQPPSLATAAAIRPGRLRNAITAATTDAHAMIVSNHIPQPTDATP
jgi:hypothetical protein